MRQRTDANGFSSDDLLGLVIIVGFSVGVNLFGATIGRRGAREDWYKSLAKSPLEPPGLVFAIAWPILDLLSGVAAFLVWQSNGVGYYALWISGLCVWSILLILKGLWTPLFFRWRLLVPSFVVLIGTLIVAITTSILFGLDGHYTSAWLQVPLMLWLCFAIHLQAHILQYNDSKALKLARKRNRVIRGGVGEDQQHILAGNSSGDEGTFI